MHSPCGEAKRCARTLSWYKLPLMASALLSPSTRFAFWMDEAGVGGEYPPATVNGGHFGVVSGELGARLLRRAWQVYPAPKPDRWWEQSALIYLFGGERAECRKDIRAFDCARHLAGELGRWSRSAILLSGRF